MRPRTELAQFKGHGGPVTAVAATPDGARVVTASSDRTARIWDAKTGVQQARLKGHTGSGHGGRRNAGRNAGRHRIGRQHGAHLGRQVRQAASQDRSPGRRHGRGSDAGRRSYRYRLAGQVARVWDIEQPAATAIEIRGHSDAITAVAAMGDGRIVTGSSDRTTRIWKLAAISRTRQGAQGASAGRDGGDGARRRSRRYRFPGQDGARLGCADGPRAGPAQRTSGRGHGGGSDTGRHGHHHRVERRQRADLGCQDL